MDQAPPVSFCVEFLKAIPSMVTAVTAIYGVTIAKAGLDKWRQETIGKRKAELAEEVLADFCQVRDIIKAARSPAGYDDEGRSRTRAEWENENDSRTLDSYFRTSERLMSKNEFFAQLFARRYRFIALFSLDAAAPYDQLTAIRAEIIVAVRMLLTTYRQRNEGSLPEDCRRWEATIGWTIPEEDSIPGRLDRMVEAIENTCRPAVQESIRR